MANRVVDLHTQNQRRCLRGYHPAKRFLPTVASLVMCLAVLSFTTAPTAAAEGLPVSRAPSQSTAESAAPLIDPYTVHDAFFRKDMVAKDVTPEFLALVNKPSLDLAIAAYQKQMLNVATFTQAVRFYEAVRGYYEALIESKYGLTLQKNPQAFYRKMLEAFGYQDVTVTLPQKLQPYDPMALTHKNFAAYLRRSLATLPTTPGGQGQ